MIAADLCLLPYVQVTNFYLDCSLQFDAFGYDIIGLDCVPFNQSCNWLLNNNPQSNGLWTN